MLVHVGCDDVKPVHLVCVIGVIPCEINTKKLMHVSDFSQTLYMYSTCGDMKPQQFLGAQVVWLLSNRVVKLLFSEDFYCTLMYKVGNNSL